MSTASSYGSMRYRERQRAAWFWRGALALLALFLVAGAFAGYQALTGNFHTVEEGRVYRSGPLSADQLERIMREKQIRTVINLRGNQTGNRWYDEQLLVVRMARGEQVDIAMPARRQVSDATLEKLTATLASAERPILIQCSSGADRTGLAVAIYLYSFAGKSAVEAKRALSIAYGHFPWFGSRTKAMDATFDRYVAARPMPGK